MEFIIYTILAAVGAFMVGYVGAVVAATAINYAYENGGIR